MLAGGYLCRSCACFVAHNYSIVVLFSELLPAEHILCLLLRLALVFHCPRFGQRGANKTSIVLVWPRTDQVEGCVRLRSKFNASWRYQTACSLPTSPSCLVCITPLGSHHKCHRGVQVESIPVVVDIVEHLVEIAPTFPASVPILWSSPPTTCPKQPRVASTAARIGSSLPDSWFKPGGNTGDARPSAPASTACVVAVAPPNTP